MNTDNAKQETSKNEFVYKILYGIILVVIFVIAYLWFINSSFSQDKFFGFIAFRMPFERTEHYCAKVAKGLLSTDTDKYYDCILNNGTVDERLQAWWHKQGPITDKQAECLSDITKKYLSDGEIEIVLDGGRIDRVPDIEGMLNDATLCGN